MRENAHLPNVEPGCDIRDSIGVHQQSQLASVNQWRYCKELVVQYPLGAGEKRRHNFVGGLGAQELFI